MTPTLWIGLWVCLAGLALHLGYAIILELLS